MLSAPCLTAGMRLMRTSFSASAMHTLFSLELEEQGEFWRMDFGVDGLEGMVRTY